MLRVEQSARQRFALLGGVLVVFLGGMVLSGIAQRFSGSSATETGTPDPKEMARLRLEAQRFRELRAEASVLAKNDRWNDIVRLLTNDNRMRDSGAYLRAEAAMRSGNLDEARKGFLSFLPTDDPVSQGMRYLLEGKTDEYRRLCEQRVTTARLPDLKSVNPTQANEANNVAWLAALAPNALSNYDKALALANAGVEGAEPEDKGNFLNTLGAVQYRAGLNTEAIATFRQAEKQRPEPFNWPFLAMAYHDTGNTAEAERYYQKLRDHLNTTFAQPPDMNRHELVIFFHETETKLGKSPVSHP
jgi:tetratricopeptide (TPR) repeat protein